MGARSSGVIVVADESSASRALLVPVSGAVPRTLALPAGADQVRVHPDGKQVVFSVGKPAFELWALENFLPAKGVTR